MVCPRCGHQNDDARKYCRGCAKPLASQPPSLPTEATPTVGLPPADALPLAEPRLNKLALASLLLSVFAFIFPLGIVAIVLGHISRFQIARSGGRQKGMGTALAGLLMGYLELGIVALAMLLFVGVWTESREFPKPRPNFVDLILDRLAEGDPAKVTPEKTARHRENTLAALRVIRDNQAAYLAAQPGQGYACQLDQLGLSVDDLPWMSLIRESDYDVRILRCSPLGAPSYVVLAIPRSEGNHAEAATYCLDPAHGIESYDIDQARDAIPSVVTRANDPCPLSGTHVE
jgi:hypothetical protein